MALACLRGSLLRRGGRLRLRLAGGRSRLDARARRTGAARRQAAPRERCSGTGSAAAIELCARKASALSTQIYGALALF